MIITKLTGGLGNQLFQYAFGLKWAIYYNTELKLDLSWFKEIPPSLTKRAFVLDYFNIPNIQSTSADFKCLNLPILQGNKLPAKLWNKLIQKMHPSYIKQKSLTDLYLKNKVPDNTYLDGTWITKYHCDGIQNILRSQFKIKQQYILDDLIDEKIKQAESVAIHIRRGDYLDTGFFVLEIDYFIKGIELLLKVTNKELSFFVFSDDIDWCQKLLLPYGKRKKLQMTLIDLSIPTGVNDIYHFYLMKNCKHFIIPISTFSWWAAWLSDYENKVVVCPSQFEPQNIPYQYLLLNDWKVIKNAVL